LNETMDQSEWETLDQIRRNLNQNLMAYDSHTQEKFAELLVQSLEGKSDGFPHID
jgi:hypothetical protein